MQDASPFDYSQPPRQGLSKGAKIGIGCGVLTLILLLICGGLIYFGFQQWRKFEAIVEEYEARGYVRVAGQVIEVTQPVNTPTVYFGQVVNIRADVNADIAVIAQVCEVFSTIDGNLDFFGQLLTIHPQAVVTGDVHVRGAQTATNRGTVHGRMYGDYPSPTRTPPPPSDAAGTAPDMDPAAGDAGEE
jgi:hypothetical protein